MELNVVAKIRITPREINCDLDEMKGDLEGIIEEYGKLHSAEIKPVAFGLNSLEVVILLDDTRGGIEDIEERIKRLHDVSQVDVIEVNRI
ncbi:MAG: elongation factor 1-beta [Candidatus Altiarchaeales archaeon]|nr:MAG: elongation factor 1-beta [Candidatus Altiarchaeales archaeon]RLI94473.1 MAG: elongation factor 1-beta [Candidatus Altiarchaeales archaeon]RLI94489.1 MAG: elongation factor 1-beta [Candidatus Altiarchaeales archaeon]HDO82305.1 elongation factor 1-beta [Candidatus Altiarchaeales archaeon]HEX54954.1 elongation factor 1-beta [Candidatus Altiarchaeales archaeon]